MVRELLLGAAIAAASLSLVAPVYAATISIRLSEAGYGSLTSSAVGDTLVLNSSFGTFTTNIATGAISGNPLIVDLGSTNFSSAAAGTLTVEVSISDLTIPTGKADFMLQMSGHQVYGAAPGKVSVAAYMDPGNAPFGTTTALGASGFLALPAYFSAASSANLTAPFSVTEALTIKSGGLSGFSLDASLSGAVPEASTWAMMFAGFGGLGIAAFQRRRKAPVSALL